MGAERIYKLDLYKKVTTTLFKDSASRIGLSDPLPGIIYYSSDNSPERKFQTINEDTLHTGYAIRYPYPILNGEINDSNIQDWSLRMESVYKEAVCRHTGLFKHVTWSDNSPNYHHLRDEEELER